MELSGLERLFADGCDMKNRLKKAWVVVLEGTDRYRICFREVKNAFTEEFDIDDTTFICPPTEKQSDGSRMDINEARKLGVEEKGHSFGFFSEEDLITIRDAINRELLR